jgi:hypothetical protein
LRIDISLVEVDLTNILAIPNGSKEPEKQTGGKMRASVILHGLAIAPTIVTVVLMLQNDWINAIVSC